jgi:DNA-binding TFAR19-related protein (PDSD5 family)
MLELQRKMLMKKEEKEAPPKPEEPSHREILGRYFEGRAWEVYDTAWAQFPQVMPQVEEALVEAFKSGKVRERVDGEGLYQFLREVGLPVRLNTTIRYKEHGELKTIGQRMRER